MQKAAFALALAALGVLPTAASAYQIEDIGAATVGDFVLEQAKIEVTLDPGQTETRNVMVTNRTGHTQAFKVVLEDFIGTSDGSAAVRFLGDAPGPYSIREGIKPEVTEFTLDQGQRINIPITIKAADDKEPGGYYTALIVSNVPDDLAQGSGAQVVSRVAQLIFTRVTGPVEETGTLRDFKLKPEHLVYGGGPYTFEMLMQNEGSVHLAPYGTVIVRNIFGSEVGGAPVDAYYALPHSMRYREVTIDRPNLFGLYRAELTLHHGYKTRPDEISTMTVWFVVLPWKPLLVVLIIAVLLALAIRYVRRNFTIQRAQ
jgi:hypothetical protein